MLQEMRAHFASGQTAMRCTGDISDKPTTVQNLWSEDLRELLLVLEIWSVWDPALVVLGVGCSSSVNPLTSSSSFSTICSLSLSAPSIPENDSSIVIAKFTRSTCVQTLSVAEQVFVELNLGTQVFHLFFQLSVLELQLLHSILSGLAAQFTLYSALFDCLVVALSAPHVFFIIPACFLSHICS